jgi:choline-phosphate cytidylyltransferase
MAKGKPSAAAVKNRKPTPHPKDKAGTIKQFKKVTGIRKQKAPELVSN